jgi:mono/diheme cytochrome c family protein
MMNFPTNRAAGAGVLCLLTVSLIFLLGFHVIGAEGENIQLGSLKAKGSPGFGSWDLEFILPMPPSLITPAGGREPGGQFDAKVFYGQQCKKCHGGDGAGTDGRTTFPDIPDFTSKSWHKERTDAQLEVSILEGKGNAMPPFSQKLGEEEAKSLRKLVRRFAEER